MKLEGYRLDGTLRVRIPGGVTILLKGDLASPPLDDTEADRFGPWIDPDTSLSWQERQTLAKRLDRSRVVPAHTFTLQFPFQKKKAMPEEADTTVAVPEPEVPKSKPLSKGDLLARITEIAQANAAEDEAKDDKTPEQPKPPRNTLKRLKLEYEVDDRAVEKPVSEVAQSTDEGPPATVPDHLKPMEKRS